MDTSDLADRLGEASLGENSERFALQSSEDNRRAAAALSAQARRTLDILTQDLEPAVYDHRPFLDAVRDMALRGRGTRIRVLVRDSSRAVTDGHRLIELARQLTTYIELRNPSSEYDDFLHAFLIADGRGVLQREVGTRYDGSVCFNDPRTARELLRDFDEMWEHGKPDPELRRLHL